MMMGRSVFTGALALVFLLTAIPAKAAVLFEGSAVGSWVNVSGSIGTDGVLDNSDAGGVASISWGTPGSTIFNNQFTFDGVGSDPGDPSWSINSETPFQIGVFTYRNGSVQQGSHSFTGVDLSIALSFVTPAGLADESFSFHFDVTNTPNLTGDPVLDGDIVTVSAILPPIVFVTGGVEYTLELLGFSTDAGKTITTDFSSPEGAIATADVYAQITSRIIDVPEPGTLALLAFGLGGIGFLRRRRKLS